MTNIQEQQIREFRMKGAGYKAIASVLGLSRDVVRNYCKSHNLDGYAPEVALNMEERKQNIQNCPLCKKIIKQPNTGRRRKFCSEKCRRLWWSEHPETSNRKATAVYKLTCIYCGQVFTVYGNKKRKYCCHECYVHDRFWRKEEGREPYEANNTKFGEVKDEWNEMADIAN